MKPYIVIVSCVSLGVALTNVQPTNALHKREDGAFSCYTATNIWDFSALCPNINYPIENDNGLSVMGQFYFALASTTVPDDTVYKAEERIICMVQGKTGNITAAVGTQAGNNLASVGASVSFTLTLPNLDGSSICMFTQGTDSNLKNVTDDITLAQARNLLYIMLTAPNFDCKTCGRIPIHYPNVTDGSGQGGGILKIDRIDSNSCIGKCVGPNSFSLTSASASSSSSAGVRFQPSSLLSELGIITFLLTAWSLGVASFAWRHTSLARA